MIYSHYLIRRKWICVCLISLSTLAFSNSEKSINFEDALKIALNNNPRIKSSHAMVQYAEGNILEADSMNWPKLNFELNGARSDNPLNVFGYKLSQGNASFGDFGADQFTGPGSLNTRPNALNHPGYYSNIDKAFKLSVPIYAGGKIMAQQKNARATLLAAQQGNQHARNQIAYQLLEAYEGVLAANRMIFIAKEQVSRAKNYLKTTQKLAKQSITLESDVLMARSYLNASTIALSNAISQSQNQLDSFRTILGNPNSRLTPRKPIKLSAFNYNLVDLTAKALQQSPDIHATKAKIAAEKANIIAAQSAYKPQINLELRQDWNGETIGEGLPSNIVALGFQWTLFSGSERSGAVQKAIANAKRVKFELDDQRNQLILTIRQLKRDETQARYAYRVNQEMTQQQNLVIKTLEKRFGKGLVPLGALLESQLKLTQTKIQVIQALYNQKIIQGHYLMLTNDLTRSKSIT